MWLCELHISLKEDKKLNPGPKPDSCENFSVCHWNLDGISAHNFSKVSLLNAYTSQPSFLSETY